MDTNKMDTNEQNYQDLYWNAMRAGAGQLYPLICSVEYVCCGAFVASSVMCAAAFAAFSEWF
jgi:hypothetical protein